MKKTLIILTLITSLVACGDKEEKNESASKANKTNTTQTKTKTSKKTEKLSACSVLSKDFVQANFTEAQFNFYREGGRTYSNCSTGFKSDTSEYTISLTIGANGGVDESILESSVSYFKSKGQIEEISGVGEKAYNRTGGSDQISAIKNGNLIHVTVYKDNKYDLELGKEITNKLFNEI